MGGKHSRTKGHNFERLIARELQDIYPDAKRGLKQTRQGDEEADVEGTPFWIECKKHRRVSLQKAWEQAVKDCDDRGPIVVHQDDRGPRLVTMEWETFKRLVNGWEFMNKAMGEKEE